ncbi:MAG TPA: hypothetical protein VGJ22_05530 [Anaerolineales bacterium]|jgi:uncharacterized protein YjlB
MMSAVQVTPWAGSGIPTRSALTTLLMDEGLSPYAWSNGPFDTYAAHSHTYNKVICVAQGSITFDLPDEGRALELHPGDRLDLPAGVVHAARVGSQGVVCLEAQG